MFLLAVLAVFPLIIHVVSAKWLDCGPPKSFVVNLENNEKYFVYNAEMKVKYYRDNLAVYKYPGLDYVNLLIDGALVNFSGLITPKVDQEPNIDCSKSYVFETNIAGSARLVENELSQTLSDYHLYLSRDFRISESTIPKKVQIEIIHEAALCVKWTFHETLGVITLNDTTRGQNKPYNFGSISVFSDQSTRSRLNASDIQSLITAYDETSQNGTSNYGLQSTVNVIVDYAVARIVNVIRMENQGKFDIPDLHEDFSTGSSIWRVTGGFDAFNGFFEDLTSFKRTHGARLSSKGSKFVASCGFGLETTNLEYRNYKLRYGVATLSGRLSASLAGIGLMAAVGVDYGQRPCKAFLQDLQVSDLGELKIRFTGLGPLNKLLSKLVTWITKKCKNEIFDIIEKKLSDILKNILNNFNCEKFRL
ncbi:hypothetical protein QAD02_014734 [Eretmocerus hayati]|uniref:Uncharacterized protein n=1 Tax=Eretmocerus hayati TaxID=131215 RepID=A0ACC2P6B5_9HYME|nr:hypothetical protein QAD02_014734 [Eretmocerus hayati]